MKPTGRSHLEREGWPEHEPSSRMLRRSPEPEAAALQPEIQRAARGAGSDGAASLRRRATSSPGDLLALQQTAGNRAVQRMVIQRRPIDISSGAETRTVETSELTPRELRGLQRKHPEVATQIAQAIRAGEFHQTRFRTKHAESEGESEEETPPFSPAGRSYFRALRAEEKPHEEGLRPPAEFGPAVTARQHVTAGTRATVKSPWISGTHSMRVAGAWAAFNEGLVAKFQIPTAAVMHDLTTKRGQQDTGLVGMGLNAAKSSQEIIVRGKPPAAGIPPEYIEKVYRAAPIPEAEYNRRKRARESDELVFRTRRMAGESPVPILLTEVYDRERASERRLEIAREAWDMVDEEIRDELEEKIHNAHRLDFISNQEELDRYLEKLRRAVKRLKKRRRQSPEPTLTDEGTGS